VDLDAFRALLTPAGQRVLTELGEHTPDDGGLSDDGLLATATALRKRHPAAAGWTGLRGGRADPAGGGAGRSAGPAAGSYT
jgi:hypothetical protein